MKRFIIITIGAILAASCSFESNEVSQRSNANLASMQADIMAATADFAVTLLSNIDLKDNEAIFADGFDTTAVHALYGYEITVLQGPSDSTWTYTCLEDGTRLDYVGNLKMTGRDSRKLPVFVSDFGGTYDEGDGYTATFSSLGDIKFRWEAQSGTPYYGYSSISYSIFREGKMQMTTYYENTKLDEITLTFKDDSYSW
ncbi:MAG: hypothetical protein IJ222_01615 [Bacteroidales bacterium]|nr:hypothetical protein [Bacteroidales bacterium]